MLVLLWLAALPLLWLGEGTGQPPLVKAGIRAVAATAESAAPWRAQGVAVRLLTPEEIRSCRYAVAPGIVRQTDSAGATAMPWLDANGWRFRRAPGALFCYEPLPQGKLPLAAAEAHAYGVQALLRVEKRPLEESELRALSSMLEFLAAHPVAAEPPLANIALRDDGSDLVGEVMNLLNRRNLLFVPVAQPRQDLDLYVQVGAPPYPEEEALDPYRFALKLRQQLGERRLVRLYGSEVVLAYLTGKQGKACLHLLNYSGRPVEGLRVRLRGNYKRWQAWVAPGGAVKTLDDWRGPKEVEFTIADLAAYAIVELWE